MLGNAEFKCKRAFVRDIRLRPELLRIVALLWLVFAFSYALGAISATKRSWPYPQILEVWRFAAGHPEARTTLWHKILNDTGVLPLRHLVQATPKAHPDSAYDLLAGLSLNDQRDPPLVYLGERAARGFRIIVGAFDFRSSLHGVILLNPDGKVQNTWQITQNDLEWTHSPDHLIFPHGFEVLRDGSIIIAYEGGNSLTKYDYCGRKLWQLEGGFHHSIDLFDQSIFWVWGNSKPGKAYGHELMRISVEDGSIIQRINLLDIINANPEIDILGIRQTETAHGAVWAADPFHENDIDPLPTDLTIYYSQFDEEDLLLSLRSLNLIFVLDPQTLEIKWWRQGLARRQHDPDWNARGTITVFNNNMHRNHSSIIEVDPRSMERQTLVSGADHNFYTWHRGKHQELQDGSFLITSSEQGRVFEVTRDGTVTFDFHNIYSEQHGALRVSEARFLDLEYFLALPDCEERSDNLYEQKTGSSNVKKSRVENRYGRPVPPQHQ